MAGREPCRWRRLYKLGSYAGPDGTKALYAYKIDVKSPVWYSPENFEDAGCKPQTMEELKALTDRGRWRHASVHWSWQRRGRPAGRRTDLGGRPDAAHPAG